MTGNALDSQRWQCLAELFDRALELDQGERETLLTGTKDEQVRAELARMLAADAASDALDTADAADARARVARLLRKADGASLAGRRIGPWRLERMLGSGGMGLVFLAVRDDGVFEQQVALKLLRAELADDLLQRRFREERRVLATLSHPCIARLLDGGVCPERGPWYAMEYVDGLPLTEWCDARRLSVAARLELFCKVCEAVDFAHRHLVIHRDLKPGNILVDADGEPKLLDFGIAKLLPAPDAQTRSDTRMMTPEYAAPEQLRHATVSAATDVYALGAVLFELLTGQRPFADPLGSRDPPSAPRACPTNDPRTSEYAAGRGIDARRLRNAMRGDLERILRRALEPDPARRYQGASAFARDLRRHLQGKPISLRHDRGYRLGRFARRHRLGVGLGTIAALILMATSISALWQAHAARVQAARARDVEQFMIGVFSSADPTLHAAADVTARKLLDAGARNMRLRFGNDPEFEADLGRALARSYAGIGAFDPACALTAQALDATLVLHGEGSPQALAARADYAEILQAAGRQGDAQRQARRVLQEARADDALSALRVHLVNAVADSQSMRDGQAEMEAKQALALAATLSAGREHWQAAAWSDLAQVYLGRGRYDEARHALLQAIMLYRRAQGETPEHMVDPRANLVFLLLHSGQVSQALSMYTELATDERHLRQQTLSRSVLEVALARPRVSLRRTDAPMPH